MNLCKKFKLLLIEDAAHAVGSKYRNKKIGTHGFAACFSFHPVKNLAMPVGGAITLNGNVKRDDLEKLKALRWSGISNRKGVNYQVNLLGWNYYMNEFSAAIGIEQLKKLDKMNDTRKKTARRYSEGIGLDTKMPFDKNCSYHFYWILVKNRLKFMKKMKENDIETGIHYHPIHKFSLYKENYKLPITEKVSKKIVSLPIHPNLSESDVDRIIKCVNKFS